MKIWVKLVGVIWIVAGVFALLLTSHGWGFAIEGKADLAAIFFIALGVFVVIKA